VAIVAICGNLWQFVAIATIVAICGAIAKNSTNCHKVRFRPDDCRNEPRFLIAGNPFNMLFETDMWNSPLFQRFRPDDCRNDPRFLIAGNPFTMLFETDNVE